MRFVRGIGDKRRMTDEQIIERYKELRDSMTVGAEAGCSGTTVLHILHRTGNSHLVGKGGGRGRRKVFKPLTLTDEEIIERYKAGASLSTLVDQTGAGYYRIRGIIEAAGVPIRDHTTQQRMMRRK